MTMLRILAIHWFDEALKRILSGMGYEIRLIYGVPKCVFIDGCRKDWDIIYYASFIPPYLKDLRIILNKKARVVYGTHTPLYIKHMYRPTHILHNMFSLMKTLYAERNPHFTIHSINQLEYNILKRYFRRVYYIPLGVDTEKYTPKKKYDRFTVLFSGPRYQKGADLLPYIVPKLVEKIPDIRFLLAGIGFYTKIYKELRQRYPENIVIGIDLPHDEFREALYRSHVLLFPSRFEGCPRIVLEALSCGTVIVGFRVPGVQAIDIVDRVNAGHICSYPDVYCLMKGIARMHALWRNDPEKYYALSKRSREIAVGFDWRKLAPYYDQMFRSIIVER